MRDTDFISLDISDIREFDIRIVFVYYFNPSSATVALILNERDELLVCRRAKEPAKGTLDLPGGKLRDYTRVVNGRNPIVAHEYLGDSVF